MSRTTPTRPSGAERAGAGGDRDRDGAPRAHPCGASAISACTWRSTDIGTGYTSIAQLRALPVDEPEIDGAFVMSLDKPHERAIVELMVRVARRTSLVVAEGATPTSG